MEKEKAKKAGGEKEGFVTAIILIVGALVALGYFGFNVKDIMDKPLVKKNLEYGRGAAVFIWGQYLKTPSVWFWDNVVVDIAWKEIQEMARENN